MATSSNSKRAPRTRLGPKRLVLLAGAGFLAVSLQGCGQTQVSAGHRDLVLRLATGTSTRDQAIIDRVATEVDELAADHSLTDAEVKTFRSIVDTAREGNWERAQELAYALRDGQHPTAEDQERIAKRPLPPIKKVGARKSGH